MASCQERWSAVEELQGVPLGLWQPWRQRRWEGGRARRLWQLRPVGEEALELEQVFGEEEGV